MNVFWSDPNKSEVEQKQAASNTYELFVSLASHPGWKALDAYYAREESLAFDALQKATSGDAALRAAAAFSTIKSMRELPAKAVAGALEVLRNLQDPLTKL